MSDPVLRLERAGHVRVLRLADLASLDDAGRARLAAALDDARDEINGDRDARVVVVAGGFGAPSEPAEAGAMFPAPRWSLSERLAGIDRPLVAAIGGDAVGQGLELALSCDIRLCAEHSRFGLPQVAGGLIPWDGGTQRLPRTVGKANALRLVLTGALIDAREALRIGLVSQVVAADRLDGAAMDLARDIASRAPIALRYAREAVHHGMDLTLEQGLRLEADLYFLLHTTHDRTAGIRAFQEKKKEVRFEGR